MSKKILTKKELEKLKANGDKSVKFVRRKSIKFKRMVKI